MADNGASGNAGGPGDAPPSIPYYEKSRQHLKELLAKKRQLEKQLAVREDMIYQKETEYLENTPSGNIITGFDNYTKATTGAAAQRRKAGLTESSRVFSRSSISYNANNAPDAQTPGSVTSGAASHAPTPVSSSFKDAGSNQATPMSATATSKAGATKTKKKATAANGVEDSETDAKEAKKVRTSFSAIKKS
ncbi:hypothetical protein MAPG_06707 [Magnaporthiopsis poae ATCC 64411]|uniref:Chromatin modification-related protein EAF6 n=1 Tax=Magnaporthiopsis poae (strain ATCC 64411 / 73-15) TaxID=644358 RepID=A0A0C4E2R7_MAGP6|nr:hypothetical protein MAPG_06707 [Magnaporthiopsis poae ATCC 64411]